MKIADIILKQLGGNRFVAMTGSSHFVSYGNTLRMNLARNASKANRLDINLDADDTYTMRFFRFTAGRFSTKTYTYTKDKVTEIAEFHGIYCDQLQEIFTQVTGMYTHLF